MAGDYIGSPDWKGFGAVQRALANMIAREVHPDAIERVRLLIDSFQHCIKEVEVFHEVLQQFENTADGFQWSPGNVQALKELVVKAISVLPQPPKCSNMELGFDCRLREGHDGAHVY